MEESLFSTSWYQIADLKPRVRRHVQIHRHTYRGQDWYMLQDHSTGRFHRFSPEAYFVIGLMDGKRTLGQIWDLACARLGDDMPTQDEVITLLSQLHQADVLQAGTIPDIADMHRRGVRAQRRRWLSYVRSPVAVRLPLLDPERFLERTQDAVRPLLGWAGAILWCVVVIAALFQAGIHWEELSANVTDRVLGLGNLLLLGLVYPLVKALHELGHAYMVKRWGGEVHEMGVMFLVFVPLPYVDASAASAFRERHHRMLVGAAGILVEVFIAALAVFVWVSVEPGAVRSLAYNAMLIAGVSTLLFNGNPLLRFDAYYILGDFLEIPNLGMRANRYIGYLAQRHLLGIQDAQSPASAPGEAGWLGFYAVTAFVYRIFIMVAIGLFVASKFLGVGVVLVLWTAFGMLVLPLVNAIRRVQRDGQLRRKRGRIVFTVATAVGTLALILLMVPMPMFTVAEGVVWVPDQARVHAGADGFVVEVVATVGQAVEPGTPLVRCQNPDLDAQVHVLEAQLRELEARRRISVVVDRTAADIIEDEVGRIEAELEQMRARRQELTVRSQTRGRFQLARAEDLPGHFVRRGSPLGYVVGLSEITVRAVVAQEDVDRVRGNTRKVRARLAEALLDEIPARIVREVPAASHQLPSLALSLEGGGAIALDPTRPGESQAFERLFQFDIALPDAAVSSVGGRVYVRFEHDPEPLAFRWYRSVRRLLLSRFDV